MTNVNGSSLTLVGLPMAAASKDNLVMGENEVSGRLAVVNIRNGTALGGN